MRFTSRTTLAVAALAAVALALPASAAANIPNRTAYPLLASVLTSLTVNGPATINMDATHPGLVIRGHQGNGQQPLQVFDWAGNPIAGVPSHGGMWVAGDDFRVFPPGDIFNASITLHMHGSITIGGPTGPTIYGGPADPNTVSPCVDQPCHPGDRDMQNTTPFTTWVYDGTTWIAP